MKVGDILIWNTLGLDAQVRVIHTNSVLTYVQVLSGPRLVGERFHLTTNAAARMQPAVAETSADGGSDATPLVA